MDRDRLVTPAGQPPCPQAAPTGDQLAVGPDADRGDQTDRVDIGRECAQIARFALVARPDPDLVDRSRGCAVSLHALTPSPGLACRARGSPPAPAARNGPVSGCAGSA